MIYTNVKMKIALKMDQSLIKKISFSILESMESLIEKRNAHLGVVS